MVTYSDVTISRMQFLNQLYVFEFVQCIDKWNYPSVQVCVKWRGIRNQQSFSKQFTGEASKFLSTAIMYVLSCCMLSYLSTPDFLYYYLSFLTFILCACCIVWIFQSHSPPLICFLPLFIFCYSGSYHYHTIRNQINTSNISISRTVTNAAQQQQTCMSSNRVIIYDKRLKRVNK